MDWKKQRFMIRSNSSINKSSITKPTDRMEEYKRNKNDGDGASTEQGQVFAGPATNVAECSMCGDVGLVRNLFRCSRCNSRYQHTYVSLSLSVFLSFSLIISASFVCSILTLSIFSVQTLQCGPGVLRSFFPF